jgi:hypothetical protein
MKLKNATLLAIIGSLILFGLQTYYLVGNIKLLDSKYFEIEYLINNIIGFVGWGLIVLFFIVLYKNQRKK